MPQTLVLRGENGRQKAVSAIFNADNGAGVTVDDAILRCQKPIKLLAVYALYTTETSGTIAAATIQLGVAVAGATIVAATALENTKGIGTVTSLTLLITDIAANTPLIARHTGVATTAAGEYRLVLEYEVLP
jgi:hypothetical protein